MNPAHLIRRRPDRRRTFKRAVKRSDADIARTRAFALLLERAHPDLRWLTTLMGDRAADFIAAHEGQQITLTMKIPRREEMIEEARAADSYIQLREAEPENRAEVLEQLATLYECAPAQIALFATLGRELLSGTNKGAGDEQNRRQVDR